MIMVYHAKNSRDAGFYGYCVDFAPTAETLLKWLDEKDGYTYVADVDTDNLDTAYRLTNHISRCWLEHQEVDAKVEMARSSSVGDLFITPDGIYVVASFGFDKIREFNTKKVEVA